MTEEYKAYQRQVAKNAVALADELKASGLRLVSGGTETHLVLVDIRELIPTGREAEDVLGSVGIVVNKNMIPYDPQSANLASGIRIGSPALTTRGLKEDDMDRVAECIAMAMEDGFEDKIEKLRDMVEGICKKYPLYE